MCIPKKTILGLLLLVVACLQVDIAEAGIGADIECSSPWQKNCRQGDVSYSTPSMVRQLEQLSCPEAVDRRLNAFVVGVSNYSGPDLYPLITENDKMLLDAAFGSQTRFDRVKIMQGGRDIESAEFLVLLHQWLDTRECGDVMWFHFSGMANHSGALGGVYLRDGDARNETGLFSARDIAALIIAVRRSGQDIVVSLDGGPNMDRGAWVNQLASVSEKTNRWLIPVGQPTKSKDSQLIELLGEAPGQFLYAYADLGLEKKFECAEDKATGCLATYGEFSYYLATALFQDDWGSVRDLSAKLRELSNTTDDQQANRNIGFITSDPSFEIRPGKSSTGSLQRGVKELAVTLNHPGANGATRGFTREVADPIYTLRGKLNQLPLPQTLLVNFEVVDVDSVGRFEFSDEAKGQEFDIRLIAIYPDGSTQMKTVPVSYTGSLDELQGNESYFALLIGNQDYQQDHVWDDLKTPLGDVDRISNLLQNEYGFETKVLKNATLQEMLGAISELQIDLSPNHRLLIYYAGHGYSQNERAFWIPVDGSAETIRQYTWVNAQQISDLLGLIPAKSILVVADSCFAGGFANARAGETITPLSDAEIANDRFRQRLLAESTRRASRKLMASGADEPVADDGGNGHSIFARAFLTGLESMPQKAFTGNELFDQHILQQVGGNSDQLPQYDSIKDSGHDGGDFVFIRNSD